MYIDQQAKTAPGMSGLAFWDEDSPDMWGEGYEITAAPVDYPTTPRASTDWPTQGLNWDGLLSTAINTWGKVEAGNTQKEIAIAQINRGFPLNARAPIPPAYGQRYAPGSSPFPGQYAGGSFMGMSITTILIYGALAAGAYYLLKKD